MGKKIVYNLEIDTKNSMKSINDLTNELDVMKNELKTLSVGSDAFNELKNKVVAADSQVKNLNKSIEGMDFDQIAGEAGKFAGGVGAITGAFMLMGDTESKTMKELQENLNKSLGLVMGVKGAIEVWTSSTKLLTVVQDKLNLVMKANPIGLVVTAVAALAVGVALLVNEYNKASKVQLEFTDDMIKEKVEAELLFNAINDTTTATEDRKDAIEEVNKLYGKYLPNLLTEKSSQEDIAEAYKITNDAIWNNIVAKMKALEIEEELKEIVEEELEAREEYINLSKEEKDQADILIKAREKMNENTRKGIKDHDLYTKTMKLQNSVSKDVKDAVNGIMKAEYDKNKVINEANKKYGELTKTLKTYNHENDKTKKTVGLINKLREEIKKTTEARDLVEDEDIEQIELYNQKIKTLQEELKKLTSTQNEDIDLMPKKSLTHDMDKKGEEMAKAAMDGAKRHIEEVEEEEGTFWERMFDDGTGKGIQRAKEMGISMGIELANQISDAVFTVQQNNLQYEYDKKLDMLDEYMNNELEKYEGNEEKQLTIKKDYANKQKALEREKLKEQQKLQIAQAIAAGALGIAGTWAQWSTIPAPAGPGFAIAQTAAIVAATAIQVATIKNQKFAKGGLLNGPSHADGGILTQFGEMEGGEAVINKSSTSAFAPVLSAINQAGGGNPIGSLTGSIIDYDLLASKLNEKKVYVVSSEITNQQNKDTKIEDRASIT